MMGLLNLQGLAAKSQAVAKAPCFSLLIVTKLGWELAEGKRRVSWREAQTLCIQYPLLCFIFPIWISPAEQQAGAQTRAVPDSWGGAGSQPGDIWHRWASLCQWFSAKSNCDLHPLPLWWQNGFD